MKIKLVVLMSAIVSLFAIFGPASAMAESTLLCSTDEEPCSAGNTVTHIHHTGSSTLLSSVGNIGCSTLFLGSASGKLESHESTEGNFTFTSCKRGAESCTATELEEEKPGEVEREGHEFSWWHVHIYINWHCGFFINCNYRLWVWWWWWGPLLSEKANGNLAANEFELTKQSGLCPSTATFDGELQPLEAIYIKG